MVLKLPTSTSLGLLVRNTAPQASPRSIDLESVPGRTQESVLAMKFRSGFIIAQKLTDIDVIYVLRPPSCSAFFYG